MDGIIGDPGILYDTEAATNSGINNTPHNIAVIDALNNASNLENVNIVNDIYLHKIPGGNAGIGVNTPTGMISTIDILANANLPPIYVQYLTQDIAPIQKPPNDILFQDKQNIIQALNSLPFAEFDAYIQMMTNNIAGIAAGIPQLGALIARVNLIRANRQASLIFLNGLQIRQVQVAPSPMVDIGDLFAES
jgi:hypothetical protein